MSFNSKYSGLEVEKILDESKDVLEKMTCGEQFVMYVGGLGGNVVLATVYGRYFTDEQIQTLLSGGEVSVTGYVNTGGNNPSAVTIHLDSRTGWLKGSGKDEYYTVTDGFVSILSTGRFGDYLGVFNADNMEGFSLLKNGMYIYREKPVWPLEDIPYTLGIEYEGEDMSAEYTERKEIRTFLGITEKNLYDLVKSGRPMNLFLKMKMNYVPIVVNLPLSAICIEEPDMPIQIALSGTISMLGEQLSFDIVTAIDSGRYVALYFLYYAPSTMSASTLSLPGTAAKKIGTISEMLGKLKPHIISVKNPN